MDKIKSLANEKIGEAICALMESVGENFNVTSLLDDLLTNLTRDAGKIKDDAL